MRRNRDKLRLTELQLLVAPGAIAVLGMLLVILVPIQQVRWEARDLWMAFVFIGLLILTHVVLNWKLLRSDQLLLPIASVLTALGLIMVHRLETTRTGNIAFKQTVWIFVGYLIYIATVLGFRNIMLLKRYKYTFLIVGLALTASVAVFGREINGAKLWFNFGFFSFQPSELLKVCLVIFLAAYLDDNRDLIQAPYRLGNIPLPPLPYLGPFVAMWGICIGLLVLQKDLGPAQLFFGIFLVMLYVASGRASYVLLGLVAFLGASLVAYNLFDHVQVRVAAWLNPWPDSQGRSYQIIQALYAFGNGGVFGEGLGYGTPGYIPEVHTDYVLAAIGEETGLAGALGVVLLNILLIYRCLHIGLNSVIGFYQYLCIGFASLFGLQSFIIMAGVVKLIPLTGITLPFISYGGSSILLNFFILGIMSRISQESNQE